VFPVRYDNLHIKNKAIPVEGRGELQGCNMLRIPNCLEKRLKVGGEVFGLAHRPSSTPEKGFVLFLSLALIPVTG
jgi:hypothetical protein